MRCPPARSRSPAARSNRRGPTARRRSSVPVTSQPPSTGRAAVPNGICTDGRCVAFREWLRIDRAVHARCAGNGSRAGVRVRRARRCPCPGRRRSCPPTMWNRHACSRSARWRRNAARSRPPPAHRSGNPRQVRHAIAECRSPADPPHAGRGSSRSGSWHRDRGAPRAERIFPPPVGAPAAISAACSFGQAEGASDRRSVRLSPGS